MVFSFFRKMTVIFPMFIILFAMTGCGGKSFDYHSDNEIPNRPGVLSKDPEGSTVYDSKTGWFPKASEETPESPKKAGGKPGAERNLESTAVTGEEPADMKEYREFQEFQEWKKEEREFKEFQEWKKSKQGAKEYQEFQEWKKWREFKKWQENQQ